MFKYRPAAIQRSFAQRHPEQQVVMDSSEMSCLDGKSAKDKLLRECNKKTTQSDLDYYDSLRLENSSGNLYKNNERILNKSQPIIKHD